MSNDYISFIAIIKSKADPNKLQYYISDIYNFISKQIKKIIFEIKSAGEIFEIQDHMCGIDEKVTNDINRILIQLGIMARNINNPSYDTYIKLLNENNLKPNNNSNLILSYGGNDLEQSIRRIIDMLNNAIVEIDIILSEYNNYTSTRSNVDEKKDPLLVNISKKIQKSKDMLEAMGEKFISMCNFEKIGTLMVIILPKFYVNNLISKMTILDNELNEYIGINNQQGGYDSYYIKYINYKNKYIKLKQQNNMISNNMIFNNMILNNMIGGNIDEYVDMLNKKREYYINMQRTINSSVINNMIDYLTSNMRLLSENSKKEYILNGTPKIDRSLELMYQLYTLIFNLIKFIPEDNFCDSYERLLLSSTYDNVMQIIPNMNADGMDNLRKTTELLFVEMNNSINILKSIDLYMRLDNVSKYTREINIKNYLYAMNDVMRAQIIIMLAKEYNFSSSILKNVVNDIIDEVYTYNIFHVQNGRSDELKNLFAIYGLSEEYLDEIKKINNEIEKQIIVKTEPTIIDELISILYDRIVLIFDITKCNGKIELNTNIKNAIDSLEKIRTVYNQCKINNLC